jgi:hypothetical protein
VRKTTTLAVCLANLLTAEWAAAQTGKTFTVNSTASTADSTVGDGVCAASPGVCTLRAAIQEANTTAALDTIAFAIGTGTQRISVSAGLPAITSPVNIDGRTQPGYAGKPIVEIRGSLITGDGLQITAGGSTLRGLVVNGFSGDGIEITGGGSNVIENCYVGVDVAGTAAVRNGLAGIRIESASNRVGGTTIPQRNVISGNGSLGVEGGIFITGPSAQGNIVQGNFIGIDAAGINPLGNLGRGVAIHYASNNLVGGSQPGAGNLIAGNRASGVRIMAGSTGNIVQKNWIGINAQGQMKRGEWPEPGILSNARAVQIRGDRNYVVENILAGNTFDGVLLFDGTGVDLFPDGFPTGNVIYKNTIVGNGLNGIGAQVGINNWFGSNSIFGNALLGINLSSYALEGVQANDPGDGDTGTNGFQNFPVLTSAVVNGSQTIVSGTLDSLPSSGYAIELFANTACNVLGHGEGRYPLGGVTVTTDATGAASFSAAVAAAIPSGWALTALATDTAGSTSEFSACFVVP